MPANSSKSDFEQGTLTLLREGQSFLAQDLATEGLKQFPDSEILLIGRAVGLTRTGAATDGVSLLNTLLKRYRTDDTPLQEVQSALKALVKQGKNTDLRASVEALANGIQAVQGRRVLTDTLDAEMLSLLAEIYEAAWRDTGQAESLDMSAQLFDNAFTADGNAESGARAAMAAYHRGDHTRAQTLAEIVCQKDHSDPRALALASLLLGFHDTALKLYQTLLPLRTQNPEEIARQSRTVTKLEQAGLTVPSEIHHVLRPPRIAVFSGAAFTGPSADSAAYERALRQEIDARLDHMDIQIGYSSAAAGSDLLFVEALLERDAQVNIVLPFDKEDYIATCVRPAGGRWEMRFRNALRLAHSVQYATMERYLGHDMLFRFGNQMLHGLASRHAERLDTAPYLLVAWNMDDENIIGGAAEFIDQWTDIGRLAIIDLDELGETAPPELMGSRSEAAGDELATQQRIIKSMMFADLVGFSGLGEAAIPRYMAFLAALKDYVLQDDPAIDMINTWGDALFVVAESPMELAALAVRLRDGVRKFGTPEHGFGKNGLNVRISLHGGPVYEGHDPFRNGAPNYYGAHINRAARLEPVTVPGHIYATQQFVALLTAEESARRAEADGDWESAVRCDYVGTLSLAKNFGQQQVYHIRPLAMP
jgi:adenylate cyclase